VLVAYCHDLPKRIWLASIETTSHKILSWYFPMEKDISACCFTWTSSPYLSHWSLYGLGCGLVSMFIFDTNLELTTLIQLPPSMITKHTLPLVEHLVWKIFSLWDASLTLTWLPNVLLIMYNSPLVAFNSLSLSSSSPSLSSEWLLP